MRLFKRLKPSKGVKEVENGNSMLQRIEASKSIGYAYFLPNDGGEIQEFCVSITPENIANFLGSHYLDAEKMIITDFNDQFILDTIGGFINRCPDQGLCREIIPYLAPIQMGEKEAGEILMVSRDEADAYFGVADEEFIIIGGQMM